MISRTSSAMALEKQKTSRRASKGRGWVAATQDMMQIAQSASGAHTYRYRRGAGGLTPDFLTLSRLLFVGGGFPPGRNLRFRRTPAVSRHPPSRTSAGTPRNAPRHFNRVVRSTGTPFRSLWASSLHSRPSYQRSNEPRKRSQSGSHSQPHAPAGLNSPVRGYATALLCNARPVASGLALIRCKGKANPA